MTADLRVSSPRVVGGGGPLYWLADDDADAGEAGPGEDQADGFGWSDDGFAWRPPQLDEAVEVPPRWLGVPPRRAAGAATPTPGAPVLQTFRLGCGLPSGSAVAAVLRAASADEAWVLAAWDGEQADIERVLGAASELVPTWLDEHSEWGLVPGPLTVRAVAAGMAEAAGGWARVTAGVREVLGG